MIAISAWRSSAANLIALSVAILRREGGDGVRPIQLLLVCRLRTSILIGYDSMLLPGKQMRAFREYDQKSGCVAARQTARALRKRIANCKPIDRLAILHVLRVECSGAGIKRSRDDE